MFYNYFLKELTEDQIAILFVIANHALAPFKMEPTYSTLKFLRPDVVLQHIDFLKTHSEQQNWHIFDDLKTKIIEYNK